MALRKHWIALLLMLSICLTVSVAAGAEQGTVLSEREVRATVERFLAEKLAGRSWETTIRQLSMPQGVRLTKGARDLELVAPGSWDGWGPVSLALVVRVNGVVEKNLPLRLVVEARTEMAVASRQLLAGTVLSRDDLQLQRRDVAQAGGLHVSSIEDVVGMKLKSTVRSGAPLRSNQLDKVPVVRSGQLVSIVAESTGFKITVTGRAKSSGGIGDLIRVENMSSHREFPARVLDSATVEAGF